MNFFKFLSLSLQLQTCLHSSCPLYLISMKEWILFLPEANDSIWILIPFTFLEPLVHLGFSTGQNLC